MAAIVNSWRFSLDVHSGTDGKRKRAFALATRDVHRHLLDACRKRNQKAVGRRVAEEYRIIRATLGQVP